MKQCGRHEHVEQDPRDVDHRGDERRRGDRRIDAEALEEELTEPEELPPLPAPELSVHPIRPGDAVWVRPLNAKGSVIEIDDDEAEVQVGPARTRVSRTDLELMAATPVAEPAGRGYRVIRSSRSPGEQIEVYPL